jgi:ABC-2 type transport system ATP-binding protein
VRPKRPSGAWFHRRQVGLGWRPIAWQGWLVTGIAAAVIIVAFAALHSSAVRIGVVIAVLGLYAGVAWLTEGDRSRREGPRPTPELVVEPRAAAADPRRTEFERKPRAPAREDGPVAITVEGLTKRFGERIAVDDVSFSVGVGEVFGFLGPNGAGKTTTVRTLGTLISPTSGSAVIDGIPLSPENDVEIRRRIAIMPEAPGLYSRLTVTENLEFFAGLYGVGNVGPRIAEVLESVNLRDRAADLCGSLSKGLRQRVGLARALLSDPTILFLDEPTSGLDPVAAHEVHDLLDTLRQRGVTIFLTTHRLEEAERICDRVAIMNTRLRTLGRPEELREQLFSRSLVVKTVMPLSAPEQVFADLPGVDGWQRDESNAYVLSVTDPRLAAPDLTRALVACGADVLSISEMRYSLEDVYLELIEDDVEVRQP